MRISYSQRSQKELQEIVRYYDQIQQGLAEAFTDELQKQIQQCRASPKIGMLIDNTHRRLVMNRFPFTIVYRVVSDEIQIIAVAHQHRRPEYWKQGTEPDHVKEPRVLYSSRDMRTEVRHDMFTQEKKCI